MSFALTLVITFIDRRRDSSPRPRRVRPSPRVTIGGFIVRRRPVDLPQRLVHAHSRAHRQVQRPDVRLVDGYPSNPARRGARVVGFARQPRRLGACYVLTTKHGVKLIAHT